MIRKITSKINDRKYFSGSLAILVALAAFTALFLSDDHKQIAIGFAAFMSIALVTKKTFFDAQPADKTDISNILLEISQMKDEVLNVSNPDDISTNQFDETLEQFRKQGKHIPKTALILILNGNPEAAIHELVKFLEKENLPKGARLSADKFLFLMTRDTFPKLALKSIRRIRMIDADPLYTYQEAILQERYGSIKVALKLFSKLLSTLTFPKTEKERKLYASILNSNAIACLRIEEIEEATPLAKKSLEIGEELGDLGTVARACNSIGNIYRRKKQYDLAKNYKERTIRLSQILGDAYGMATSIGDLGIIFQEQGKFNEASDQFWSALAVAIGRYYKDIIADQFGNLAILCSPPGAGLSHMSDKFFEELIIPARALDFAFQGAFVLIGSDDV